MSEGFSIDLGSALPYLEEKILALCGKDAASEAAAELLSRQTRLAIRDASVVQIVGMEKPVSIADIYQPTRLRKPYSDLTSKFERLVAGGKSAVVLGRPGAGKTVLLHYVFMSLSNVRDKTPILFTLRKANATEDLQRFVEFARKKKIKSRSGGGLVLLVDGYDEVTLPQRREVSEALREYQSLGLGPFYLTCRSFYPVDDAGAEHYEIAPFTLEDADRYLQAFSRAYKSKIEPRILIAELQGRGFSDFITHPLMLALVCILKAGPLATLPRSAIGLLRRAVDTLTFRWDESKGVARDSRLPIDGEDRVRCMMRIAFVMKKYEETDAIVQHVATDYLKLIQRREISSSQLLTEIAQWYGMLVPTGPLWTFAHRTIHDFLAARQWIESGTFSPSRVNTWNARAAYAASLLPDATSSILQALQATEDISAFVECLYNNARFNVEEVATGVVNHFSKHRILKIRTDHDVIIVETNRDFFGLASDEFLEAMMREALRSISESARKVVFAYSASEYIERHKRLPPDLRAMTFKAFGLNKTLNVRRGSYLRAVPLTVVTRPDSD